VVIFVWCKPCKDYINTFLNWAKNMVSDINWTRLDHGLTRQAFFIGFDLQDVHNIMDFHAPGKSKLNCIRIISITS